MPFSDEQHISSEKPKLLQNSQRRDQHGWRSTSSVACPQAKPERPPQGCCSVPAVLRVSVNPSDVFIKPEALGMNNTRVGKYVETSVKASEKTAQVGFYPQPSASFHGIPSISPDPGCRSSCGDRFLFRGKDVTDAATGRKTFIDVSVFALFRHRLNGRDVLTEKSQSANRSWAWKTPSRMQRMQDGLPYCGGSTVLIPVSTE